MLSTRAISLCFFWSFYAFYWRTQFKITDLRHIEITFGEVAFGGFDGLDDYFFPLVDCAACWFLACQTLFASGYVPFCHIFIMEAF